MKNWDDSSDWYSSCVGEKGHFYHQTVVIPNAQRILGKTGSLLDLGCGQGILARSVPSSDYLGLDLSEKLLASAQKMSPDKTFLKANACEPLPTSKKDFDRAAFILSLQNMENGEGAIKQAGLHVRKGGKLLIVLNHPCFRIPRQSDWGDDERMKLKYRRMNAYMSPLNIPIRTNPGKGDAETISYHRPLSDYSLFLQKAGFVIVSIEEWISNKKSEGAKAKMEDRARKEFPLFMAILAEKK